MNLFIKDQLPDHPFWRFATKLYEPANARVLLLELQYHGDFHPNLLLFCCWFASAGRGRIAKQDIQHLFAMTANWYERIILPLQQLQIPIQTGIFDAELRQEIYANLLLAERIEQLMLTELPLKYSRSPRNPTQKLVDACKNIVTYSKASPVVLNAVTVPIIQQLLARVFPTLEEPEIRVTTQTILVDENTIGIANLQRKLEF